MPAFVIYLIAAMLVIGAAPMPYDYYTLLRLVGCGVLGYAAFVSYTRKSQALPWIYGILALLFNPFIKIHLPKEIWMLVDIGTGVLLLATKRKIEAD